MTEITATSRDRILARIKSSLPKPVGRPQVKHYTVEGDTIENFTTRLEAADGRSHRFCSRDEAIEWLRDTIATDHLRVFSAADGYQGNISLEDLTDPRKAEAVDTCVAEAELGVGETGSVWVSSRSLRLAAAALFSTDLYLLLDSRLIVDGMHEAYDRIDLGQEQYGAFYTGPSATADIEAVHITGAQGEISLTVLLY